MTNQSFIRLRDVSKVYPTDGEGTHVVFQGINLDISAGEIVCLVGPSGCGKTTLLDLILGGKSPSMGSILVDGVPVTGLDRARGIIPQGLDLYEDLRLVDHVSHGPLLEQTSIPELLFNWRSYRRKRKALREKALGYLRQMGLEDSASKYPFELSGGMKQRVAIASAMIMDHKVLLMDEFTSKLDESVKLGVQQFCVREQLRTGTTMVIVTHSLVEALFVGTRVIGLSQHYKDDLGLGLRGAQIVLDIKVPGAHPRDPATMEDEALKVLRAKIRDDVLDEAELIPASQFTLTHPDAWSLERLRGERSGR